MNGVNGHQPPQQPDIPVIDPFNPWALADLPMQISTPVVVDTTSGKRCVTTVRRPGDTFTLSLPLDVARQLAMGINAAVNNAPSIIIPTGTIPPPNPGVMGR